MSFFSQNIKRIRKEHHYSQASLAKELGITQQAVGKWETDKSLPDTLMLGRLADMFGLSMDDMLGRSSDKDVPVMVPIIGTVKAGYDAYAYEQEEGREPANVSDADGYFFLIVRGDSMEPRICAGDLALVRKQEEIQSGDLAVILVDGEESTLKRVIISNGAYTLQAFNPDYPDRTFAGEELDRISIIGKVVETKAKW